MHELRIGGQNRKYKICQARNLVFGKRMAEKKRYKREGMDENVTEMQIFGEERNGTEAVG